VSVKFTILGSGSPAIAPTSRPPRRASSWTPDFPRARSASASPASAARRKIFPPFLITHEHADHIAGLLGIADKFQHPGLLQPRHAGRTVWNFKEKWSKKTNLPLENGDIEIQN
jgi:phosphoribosyl 1,2-cyclic phosphodiesterase